MCTRCSPVQVAEDAINDARSICLREYGSAPEVTIYGDPSFTFPYVPSHLHHMVFELVKNSLRAVQDRFDGSDDDPPPIRLVVAEGGEDVTLKVREEMVVERERGRRAEGGRLKASRRSRRRGRSLSLLFVAALPPRRLSKPLGVPPHTRTQSTSTPK